MKNQNKCVGAIQIRGQPIAVYLYHSSHLYIGTGSTGTLQIEMCSSIYIYIYIHIYIYIYYSMLYATGVLRMFSYYGVKPQIERLYPTHYSCREHYHHQAASNGNIGVYTIPAATIVLSSQSECQASILTISETSNCRFSSRLQHLNNK